MAIVLDASAALELLTPSDAARREPVVGALRADPHWVVPEHFVLEVVNALRGRRLGGHVSRDGFERSIATLRRFELDVWPTDTLLPRITELLDNATSYDSAYLALAEELSCRLVTADTKLARVPGIRCQIVGPPTGESPRG